MADDKHSIIRQADAALNAGDMSTAVSGYRRVLRIDNSLADVWFNLGYALRIQRKFPEALDCYSHALDHKVQRPEEAHLNRAAIFTEQLSAYDKARTELDAALEKNPFFVVGWLNLGLLHEDIGEIAEARHAYERALQIAPQSGRALSRLAAIATFENKVSTEVGRLEAALRLPSLAPNDAVDIAFGLANLYDAKGQHEQAFALAASANQAQHRFLPETSRYDPVAHEKLIDSICNMTLPPPLLKANKRSEPKVFICGLFRSGSTLAEQLLARHSDTVAGGEHDFIPEIVRGNLQPYPEKLTTATRAELESLRLDYMSRLAANGHVSGQVTDKRCDNFLHIGFIKTLFPHAKIVHSYRAPLDNAVSLFFQHFSEDINYSMDLGHLGHWLAQYRKIMTHWKSLYGTDIHDFSYDATVHSPEAEVRAMVEHCGLAWREGSPSTNNVVKTASAWQVRQALHQRSSGRWRNYQHDLLPVMHAAGIDEDGNWLAF
jgi:tetratricopeptide (TPR) repeat protein